MMPLNRHSHDGTHRLAALGVPGHLDTDDVGRRLEEVDGGAAAAIWAKTQNR